MCPFVALKESDLYNMHDATARLCKILTQEEKKNIIDGLIRSPFYRQAYYRLAYFTEEGVRIIR